MSFMKLYKKCNTFVGNIDFIYLLLDDKAK